MKNRFSSETPRAAADADRHPKLWLALALCSLLVLFSGLWHFRVDDRSAEPAPTSRSEMRESRNSPPSTSTAGRFNHRRASESTATAEEKVAAKLAAFARLRLYYARALAERHHVEVPAEVEQFFAAVASGDWNQIESAFLQINGGDSSAGHRDTRSPEVAKLWPAIIDAYGAAEQVHEWPAQKLLDYGNAVLGALRPGMVYVGGTDNGRWIPELLNDTSDGEHHIVLTQNALADAAYLDYLKLQYEGQFASLTGEDSSHAFSEYLNDAQKRLQHDQEHPDEPKQIRPGEDVRIENGKVQVSGQIAVMDINERLLNALMTKNPELSFAIQESFPFKGTYPEALPLGPLMELRADNGANSFTSKKASESLNYWQNLTQQVLNDSEASCSPAALKSYSHDAVSAANLLAAHGFVAEAEQGYRLSSQLWPGNPESVYGLAGLLARNGRETEAQQMLDEFSRQQPDQQPAAPSVLTSSQPPSGKR